MQFQGLVGMRRIGDGKAAAAAVLQQDVDVLAGEELQALAGGQPELQQHHVGRQARHLLHAAGQRPHREVAHGARFARFYDEIGKRPRAAKQGVAPCRLVVGERPFRMQATVDLPRHHATLAGAAGAVAAAVGKMNARCQRGAQQGIAGLDLELMPAGLDRDAIGHGVGGQKREFR